MGQRFLVAVALAVDEVVDEELVRFDASAKLKSFWADVPVDEAFIMVVTDYLQHLESQHTSSFEGKLASAEI